MVQGIRGVANLLYLFALQTNPCVMGGSMVVECPSCGVPPVMAPVYRKLFSTPSPESCGVQGNDSKLDDPIFCKVED